MAECLTGTKSRVRVNTGNVRQGSGGWYYDFSMQIVSGDPATFSGGVGWSANASGVGNSGSQAINGANTYTVWSGTRGPFGWDGNGNTAAQGNSFHMNASGTQGLGGPVDCGETVYFPRVPQAPGNPGTPSWSSIQAGQAAAAWAAASRGHADIDQYLLRVNTNSNPEAPGYIDYAFGGGTLSGVATGLAPGTVYYGKVYAHNADGYSPGSAVSSFLTLPAAPTGLSASDLTPTTLTLDWADVGSATGYDVDVADNNAFTGATRLTPTASTTPVTGLTPGSPSYFRVRAKNATGAGAWSATYTATTLPATAPGMMVTPTLPGTGATVSLTPPGGATGVSKYTVERRIGTGAATSTDTPTNSLTVAGLIPGTVYQWRASAWFGTYQSPWTGWVSVTQPNPNTNPGDYFDGSTLARGDVTFSWTGTVNNSTSVANGVGVDGWAVSGLSSTQAVLQRVTGGRSGPRSARVIILRDISAATGWATGMTTAPADGAKRASVEETASYVGSIYVRPSRPQPMRASITWYDAAGTSLGSTFGTTQLVPTGVDWTRLIVSGVAPVGTVTAAVRAWDDTAAAGWSQWLSGQWLDLDDAMVTLTNLFDWFSGDTPDVPGFDYQWLGVPNASASARFEIPIVNDDPLADPDCPTPPAPPSLPTIETDCIDEVGTWRRYTITVPSTEVRQWSSTLPTLVLSTQSNAERQVRIRYFPNPDDLLPPAVAQDTWEAEQILTFIPPNTEITLDGVTERVTASVGGADPISANRLLYGTGGVPATWPNLRCGIGYVITMDVPLDAPAGNLDARVVLTQRM